MFNSDNSYSINAKDVFVEKTQSKFISFQNKSDIANCHTCMESNLKVEITLTVPLRVLKQLKTGLSFS